MYTTTLLMVFNSLLSIIGENRRHQVLEAAELLQIRASFGPRETIRVTVRHDRKSNSFKADVDWSSIGMVDASEARLFASTMQQAADYGSHCARVLNSLPFNAPAVAKALGEMGDVEQDGQALMAGLRAKGDFTKGEPS